MASEYGMSTLNLQSQPYSRVAENEEGNTENGYKANVFPKTGYTAIAEDLQPGYNFSPEQDPPPLPLKRFWIRGLICTFLPACYTAYFFIICKLYITENSEDSVVPHGARASRLVFYSWFIMGVVALNLNKYGLVGAESGMLMSPNFQARSAMFLFLHAEKSWSGPSGWFKIATKSLSGRLHELPSKSWWLLALASILPFIAIPLSGLCFELVDGFRIVDDKVVNVVGQGKVVSIYPPKHVADAYTNWRNAAPPLLRERSALYIPEGAMASNWSNTFPNKWPEDDEVDIFVAPQANIPVVGEIWGLHAQYSCKQVKKISDFKLLNQRNASYSTDANKGPLNFEYRSGSMFGRSQSLSAPACIEAHPIPPKFFHNSSNIAFEPTAMSLNITKNPGCEHYTFVFNQTNWPYHNVAGFMEIGLKFDHNLSNPYVLRFNDNGPAELEVALWQALEHFSDDRKKHLEFPYNTTIDGPLVQGMEGFYEMAGKPMEAIGVRCTTNYRLSFAEINGLTGKFKKLNDSDHHETTVGHQSVRAPYPLWHAVIQMLSGYVVGAKAGLPHIEDHTVRLLGDDRKMIPRNTGRMYWLASLFSSSEMPGLGLSQESDYTLQSRPLSAEKLNLAIKRAFTAYGIQLVRGDSAPWASQLKGAVETKIMAKGIIPPEPMLALMCAWSLLSAAMGLAFAFRKKWSDVLDGFSMFRFGTDLSHLGRMLSVRNFEECQELNKLPGLIGDMKPLENPGKIGLVKDTVAVPSKRYI